MTAPSLLRRDGLLAASALLVAGAVAFGATSGGDDGRGVQQAVSPTGETFPISRAVDPGSLVYRGKVGGEDTYLASGTGPAAGMTCLVVTSGETTRTACDERAAVEDRGLVMSEDVGSDRLRVSGYLPGGVTVAPGSALRANGELFGGSLSKAQSKVAVQRGSGMREDITIPGGGFR